MAGGVPVGAKSPCQDKASKPGSAASAIVGTSGRSGLRADEVTPIARIVPAWICGIRIGSTT